MNSPRSRKSLAQLVVVACTSRLPGPHSEVLAKVIGNCEHGHGIIGASDDSPWVKDWDPQDICASCLRQIGMWVEDGNDLNPCPKCDHPCAMEITAEWPNGNTITLRYTPQAGNQHEREVS